MTKPTDQRLVSQDQLTKLMSDVISLREKVAQAELAAHAFGITAAQNFEAIRKQHRQARVASTTRAGH